MLNTKQRTQLQRAINRHVRAEVGDSHKESLLAYDDRLDVEKEAKRAKASLKRILNNLHTCN
jgi:hypothetical protein